MALFCEVDDAVASHLRAGQISVEKVNCSALTYKITLTVYTNTSSEIKFGDGVLYFGDGTTQVPGNIPSTPRPDYGPHVGIVVYTVTHTFPAEGSYIVSYTEANRNAGILNMDHSSESAFYIETLFIANAICDSSPILVVPPIDKACTGSAWYHNPGAFDPDGDSLSYEIVIPEAGKDVTVDNYRDPNDQTFYDQIGLNYSQSNEDGSGAPTFNIDPISGSIEWNAPGAPGEYNIAFHVNEWRRVAGKMVQLGYVTRDMQIVVEDCNDKKPVLQVPADLCVEAGQLIDVNILGTDPNLDSVKIEVFASALNLPYQPPAYSPDPPAYQPTGANDPAILHFVWQTDCLHAKEQSYHFLFKITDKSPSGARLASFQTWDITIVNPAPVWTQADLDLGNRAAVLSWADYPCKEGATIQVWRRVDSFEYTSDACATGLPSFLGFTKIAEVGPSTISFIDSNGGVGLAVGAQYCYRLLVTFPDGNESLVSESICLPPIRADAPVITHVTIDKTSVDDGIVRVKWRSPFEVDKSQFPPPYTYEVYGADDYAGTVNISRINASRITDSTFVDDRPGLNTQDRVYNYRVVCYDHNNIPVDTSKSASTVRLETSVRDKKIELSWTAEVPWSNRVQSYPRHYIYRESSLASGLVLIDSVDVNNNALTYVDSGQYQQTPLVPSAVYCYRVATRGAYGNPRVEEPLINFSEVNCVQIDSISSTCQPEWTMVQPDCNAFILEHGCSVKEFANHLSWRLPQNDACLSFVESYNIYYAEKPGGKFQKLAAGIKDTSYTDTHLSSFARCYKITAVDRNGQESELSESFCFDNCPYYELPNVFTPNGDGCNDTFSAFSDRGISNGPCAPADEPDTRAHCARFVENIQFAVYNRWGKVVYTYTSEEGHSVFIDWDGKDEKGEMLAPGVYFYTADIVFDVLDDDLRNERQRGWINLMSPN